MEILTNDTMQFLCRSLSNTIGMPVRIFRGQELTAYYSVYQLSPDPARGELPRILATPNRAGVIVTALMQYFGFLDLSSGERLIIGPSRAVDTDLRMIREQVSLAGVPQEAQAEYLRSLECLPVYTMERMSWLISFLATISTRREVPLETLYVNLRPENRWDLVQRDYADGENHLKQGNDDGILLDNGYRYEQMLLTFVEQGEPERAKDLINAPPSMLFGRLSKDTLQQAKQLAVCAATIASRAAIAGGVDSRTAFHMSDLYIQQVELLRDAASANRLRDQIFVDFAREVQRVRYHVHPEISDDKGRLFVQCAEYVSQNVFSPIRSQEIADALGYTRSYLCNRFRELSGMTLTQYIQQEKIFEAQRLLRFTDQGLSELAALLAFSSQAHFQTVFKKVKGETPVQYRNRTR